jgi:beta-xylosidase
MNKNLFVVILSVFSLYACGAPAPLAVTPTNSPVPLPTETPIPPTATLDPLPTSTSMIFRDDFEGPLDAGWQWLRENNDEWSLINNPGWLEIMAGFGSISGGNVNNLLLHEVQGGNFELETRVKFKPAEEQQIAGLLVYKSASDFIQFGRGLCNAPQCVGDGFYLESMSGGILAEENFATKAGDSDIVYLRLRREGDVFTAYISENGNEWRLIGTHKNEIKPLSVGLIAGQAFSHSALTPAQFDYFVVNRLP